jgi:hypothetical protein
MSGTDGREGQAAASAAVHGAEYVLHYSGIELIVHRLVPCPRPKDNSKRYYIESSDRIPVNSDKAPPVALMVSILLAASGKVPYPLPLHGEKAPTPYTAEDPASGDTVFRPPVLTRAHKLLRAFAEFQAAQRLGHSRSSLLDTSVQPAPSASARGSKSSPIVHFDVPGMNRDMTFAVDTLATPSSPLRSLPSLNGPYWERALSSFDPHHSVEEHLSTRLLHSWHPWQCLSSQLAVENWITALELWTRSWERWRTFRRAQDASALAQITAPATYSHMRWSEHAAIVALPSTINLTECLSDAETGMTFRGTWYGASIVAKHSVPEHSEHLAREALFYKDHLEHLRGLVVPQFIGLYRSDGWALLVLEDVGSTTDPETNWEGWSREEKCVHQEESLPPV